MPDKDDPQLWQVIRGALAGIDGSFGVAVKNLVTGQMAQINGDTEYMSASLFKLSVMYEAYRQAAQGTLSFTETLTVTEKDIEYDSGTLTLAVGDAVTITKAMSDMITISDNTMGVMLLGRVKSWIMDDTMESIGLKHTRVTLEDQVTSSLDMLHMMEMIATGKAVSLSGSREMLGLLAAQKVNNRLPLYLPKGTIVAHKTGDWDQVHHDVGIVFAPSGPYVIAVLSDGLEDPAVAHEAIARLSEKVYNYFTPAGCAG